MRYRIVAIVVALTVFLISTATPGLARAELARLDLGGAWQVVREGTTEVIPATVPGCIHTDLLAAKKIPDPFYRDNEKNVQWISDANWVYRRSFDVSPELLAREHVLLRCEGLDTLATIRVNGHEVAKTDNMFRTYEFDVKRLLKAGKNEIEIRFASVLPVMRAKEKERKLPTWAYPGAGYVRKEPCNFGWDWGPTLITCGIWRNIGLVAFDTARITDVAITQDHSQKGKVKLKIDVEVEPKVAGALKAVVEVYFGKDRVQLGAIDVVQGHGRDEIVINDPKLWWPAGMGERPLYTIDVTLQGPTFLCFGMRGEGVIDSATRRIGLRTLRAIEQTKDAPMHFEVNGVPFFAKGANWIPADCFANRVSKEILHRYVDDAAECNMNCLRLWGGGYYEDDALYDACDERGICLWVDMKFGCSTYPAFDPKFLENVKQEADDNIRRLRHHPSIAVFCGNNEIMYFRGDKWTSDKMSSADYYKLFRDTLGGEVRRLAPQIDYVTGSPDCGDVHFWDVWHGGKPFEVYRNIHGFVSEFGFQSFPEPKTVKTFTEPGDRDSVYSHVMKYHERSNRMYMDVKEDGKIGTDKIMQIVKKYFREPKDFDSALRLSQITQAYGIQYGAEGWRREMPRSMGCVYWQYNDCWPCSSWASVDYFGRWKALQYAAKRFYAPVLVSGVVDAKAGRVDTYITNDLQNPISGKLRVHVTTASGMGIVNGWENVNVPAASTVRFPEYNFKNAPKTQKASDLLVWLKLEMGGKTVSENLVTLVYPRELDLVDPRLDTTVVDQGGDFRVTLTAAHPALWTWLSFDGIDARCSQNFVHVSPAEPVEIIVHPAVPVAHEDFMRALQVRSLYDTYKH